MQTNAIQRWSARATSFALAALVTLSGTYWVLKSTDANSVSNVAPAATAGFAALDPQAVARALGGGAVGAPIAAGVPSARTPFVLVGVVAGSSQGGVALISVDAKPAKPYRVGAAVDGSLVLRSVDARRAILATTADGPPQITLELPPLSK